MTQKKSYDLTVKNTDASTLMTEILSTASKCIIDEGCVVDRAYAEGYADAYVDVGGKEFYITITEVPKKPEGGLF